MTENTQFHGKIKALQSATNLGLLADTSEPGTSITATAPRDASLFKFCTGADGISDITPGQAANITLLPDVQVPAGMRCYLTRLDIDVQGAVNWSVTSPTAGSVPYLAVQDSAGVPAAVLPFNALKGLAELTFPQPDVSIPLLLGPNTVNGPVGTPVTTFTYVAATGVITTAATSFIANIGVGSPARVVDGTGKGQSAFVTACTATTCTVSPAFTGLDATSVIAIDYQGLASYTSTTVMGLFNGGATPFTANVFDNGYNLLGIASNGAGTARPILSSTTAGVLTLAQALNTAMNATTSIVQVTNEPNLNGAVDCCVGDKWATLTLGKGLVAAVNLFTGTSPVGSSVRIYGEGFFAA